MSEINISISSYSVHGMMMKKEIDIFRFMDLVKYRYRLDYIDIWAFIMKPLEEDYISKLKKSLDDKNLILANLCVDGPHLWMDDEAMRAANKEKMLQTLKAAETLGAQTIRIDFGGPSPWMKADKTQPFDPRTMTEEAFDYIVSTYKEYADICETFGAKIGPENHWGFDTVPEYLVRVKEAVNHPSYGHLFHIDDNFDGDTELGEKYAIETAMHTHVTASSIPNIKKYIKALLNAGYKGVFSVEHHSGKHELDRIEWQLGSLRAILAEVKEEGIDAEYSVDFPNIIYENI